MNLSILKLIKYKNMAELIGIIQKKSMKIRVQKRYSLSEKTVIIDDQI